MERRNLFESVCKYVRREYVEPARRRGDVTIRIVAGEVHRALNLANRVPSVCDALASRKFLEENGLALESREGAPYGRSDTVAFVYRITPGRTPPPKDVQVSFLALGGIAKEVFQSLGGGEAFIRRERNRFYR